MKKINTHIITIILLLLVGCGMVSCKKDSYLTDGGLNKAYTSFSTYDYLKNNKYHQFDTVLQLIDYYKLKDSVNSAKTFFAFTDISLNQLMKSIRIKSVDANGDTSSTPVTTIGQLTDSISSKLFTQYMFNKTITIDEATLTAVQYANEAGALAPCAIKKITTVEPVYLSASTITFNYYTLEYIKINGVLDGSSGAPADDKIDATLQCQTTGVQTSSGTTLHVLANFAVLNKL